MRTYSDFFKTLHDEQSPTGYLGRGTHYSVLRAVVFHDANGKHLPRAQFADFAVIWDEDHDDRVIEPIEKIYRCGLLSRFLVFGERKGGFTAVLANDIHEETQLSALEAGLNTVTEHLDNGDTWSTHVVSLESAGGSIIDAAAEKANLYLRSLAMLWELGVKAPSIEEKPFNPALLTKVEALELSLRSSICLKNDGILYIGDLIQKSEAEMLRGVNFGRKSLDEIKEVLAQLGLHLGTDLPSWPPKDLVALLAERFES